MTATNGLGTTGNGVGTVTSLMHKLAQSGLIAKTGAAPNAVRPGLFFDGTTNIVTGTANMSYNVAAFTAALSRGASGGTVLLANDGTVNLPTTPAPGSNSRIDVIYVWQREFSIDGVDSEPVIGVIQGSVAAVPTVPSLAAFPGALELARITVPSGVTATNSGTTITQSAPFTSAAGAPIPVRTAAALPASGTRGQRAIAVDTGVDYEWTGSAWQIVNSRVRLNALEAAPRIARGLAGVASTNASGDVTITHGLGSTPVAVMVTGTSGGAIPDRRTYAVTTITSTTFTVRVYRQDTGGVFASNPTPFYWLAVS